MKEWLSKFDTKLNTLKKMAGIAGDLTREEMVDLFKDRVEYQVVKHLDTAFAAKVDTAASHSILTHEAYDRLKNMPFGNIPDLRPETRTIQLADGSSSKQ